MAERRPIDLELCKQRCSTDPTYEQAFQQGVSVALLLLAEGIHDYHKNSMSDISIFADCSKFELTKTGKAIMETGQGWI